MLETTILGLIDERTRRETRGGRRAFMAGRSGPDGGWTWVAPDSLPAKRFLPGPFSLTLMLRGRRAGGSTA